MRKRAGKLACKGEPKSTEKDVQPMGAQLFEAVAEALRKTEPRAERVKLFGFDCLRIAGKVFAKVSKGRLIVKLPAARVAALMMAGQVEPYAGARGEMKEWAVVVTADERLAIALSQEARSFVSS
jgi:TfoX/Sxy family transcriptional regulator of competence genes